MERRMRESDDDCDCCMVDVVFGMCLCKKQKLEFGLWWCCEKRCVLG